MVDGDEVLLVVHDLVDVLVGPWVLVDERFGISVEDRELVQTHGLHVGRVIDEYKERFGRGDFLIRNLLGADTDNPSAFGLYQRLGFTRRETNVYVLPLSRTP